jgi:hypothetical protein
MALDESAMTDLLAALRAGGGLDVVRQALALVLQALIDAEAAQPRSAAPRWHRPGHVPGGCLRQAGAGAVVLHRGRLA